VGKILFITGPIGLGHISRELEVVRELRKYDPKVEIIWFADEPAASFLKEAGERVPYQMDEAKGTTNHAESVASDYTLCLCTMFLKWLKTFDERIALYNKIIAEENVDTIVGDEAMDLLLYLPKHPEFKKFKFVYLSDFFGAYQVRMVPQEIIATRIFNSTWTKFMENPSLYDKFVFIGEKEDIDEGTMGLMLPKRRKLAYEHVEFAGQILPFVPEDYLDKVAMKQKLGYDQRPLIICTAGGTAAGKALLDLCSKSYPLLEKAMPDARMKIVCGPRIPPQSIVKEDGVEVEGYVPKLFEHFAAADLVITSGGGTSTLELTALQKPFLYFPFLKHWEQNHDVVRRCERYNAGVRMDYGKTSPETLCNAILDNIGKEVNYHSIPLNGAINSAKTILEIHRN
jgi:UDP:flavonoid glycosyltransferase YjiC (YdhE family)